MSQQFNLPLHQAHIHLLGHCPSQHPNLVCNLLINHQVNQLLYHLYNRYCSQLPSLHMIRLVSLSPNQLNLHRRFPHTVHQSSHTVIHRCHLHLCHRCIHLSPLPVNHQRNH
jgi:hypothetical protein